MTKPKLTYFDSPASRGEECRIAFHVAGVPFDDNRIKREEWAALKPTTPFGSLPVLEMPRRPALGQSNAILVLIGRLHDLHPADPYEAARHEAMMGSCEDLRATVGPTLRLTDENEKKKAREALAASYLPTWGQKADAQIGLSGDGPFFGGAKLQVADIKLYMIVRWIAGGKVDYVPPTIFAAFPKVMRVHDSVRDDARVRAWNARWI
jgi:glutathione S-transferase